MSKLRINYIDDDMSPRKLRKLLGRYGRVEDLSIHSDGTLIYGLAEMAHDDAVAVMNGLNNDEWEARMGRAPRPRFSAEMANRSRMEWLSHEWRPRASEKGETLKRQFSAGERPCDGGSNKP